MKIWWNGRINYVSFCSRTWETDIPSDMCSPTQEMHIFSDMCIVLIMQDMIKTMSLTSFFYGLFLFCFLQQFLAGENLKVAVFW